MPVPAPYTATENLERLSAEASEQGVRDLTRECFCTCHIGWVNLQRRSGLPDSEVHVLEVTCRIRCTVDGVARDPDSNTLCVVCGRTGRDRYLPIPDLTGMNLGVLADIQRKRGTFASGPPEQVTARLVEQGKREATRLNTSEGYSK